MSDALRAGAAPRVSEAAILRAGLWLAAALLAIGLVLPLAMLLARAFMGTQDEFVGLAHFIAYVRTPSLFVSAWNSVWTAALTTVIVVPLAFSFAYGLARSCMPARGLFRAVMLIPILAPSLLPALSLIYLFGNQGLLRFLMPEGSSIYGAPGIVMAQVIYTFPHAAIILAVALGMADARLFEAAQTLKAGHARIFRDVTLPAARYGLVSAAVVVFTLVMTDFGIPKVIGGQFPVLATDVYKQVIGQQNFSMGAVVAIVLLLPALFSFFAERWAQRMQSGAISGRAVLYVARPRLARDGPLFALCLVIAAVLIGIVAMAVWGSLIRFWPYNMTLTWANYDFARFDSEGWGSLTTSLAMAGLAAVFGTPVVFITAYLLERGAAGGAVSGFVRIAAIAPLAVPGLVLGLAYILFFNHPANPLGFLYGTLAILVLNCVVHFYTVAHLTAVTAIRQLDPEFEAVGASLRVPRWITFGRVVVPISLPAILEIGVYIFVNAMTTVSAVVFLYGPGSKPASVAVVQMDEAGQVAAAAAMACVILGITASVKLAQIGLVRVVSRKVGWRARG
ncbi:putative 2-aminoethylphosphonate ABC transporter permease subunit [Sediminicoccus sp. KRV36]|uniref:putative 2-aminoethylphosphonate ABC transporter permease subunit n=1 Tax=Sediminicoccus sp. KRV36 TaxID=3133721 RepID=UPI00200DA722|nr:putative 2-aminoethylphosphonate ABC transporter permease subunit [Sediminicoccus rosea]UPY38599.1 putative 2-aminoethylphosphonate ABC transporter permease subunit [Sediminicoccus rosea]